MGPRRPDGTPGAMVDAQKRVCLGKLPATLVIQLKRFELNYETMARLAGTSPARKRPVRSTPTQRGAPRDGHPLLFCTPPASHAASLSSPFMITL